MTHQKRIVVHGARLVAGGMLIPLHIVDQLRSMGVVIVDEQHGIKIVENPHVPPGKVWIIDPERVGIVTDIDAHQRAMSTPFFNDLAG